MQVTREVQEEIEKRYSHLMSRLTGLKAESEENWKTIETAEKTLLGKNTEMELHSKIDSQCLLFTY